MKLSDSSDGDKAMGKKEDCYEDYREAETSKEPGSIKELIEDKIDVLYEYEEFYKEEIKKSAEISESIDKRMKYLGISKPKAKQMQENNKDINKSKTTSYGELTEEQKQEAKKAIHKPTVIKDIVEGMVEKEYKAFYKEEIQQSIEKPKKMGDLTVNYVRELHNEALKDKTHSATFDEIVDSFENITSPEMQEEINIEEEYRLAKYNEFYKPRKVGRPTVFDDEIRDKICENIRNGKPLRVICENENMPGESTIFAELNRNKQFQDKYARAHEIYANYEFENLIKLSDEANERNYNALRLKVDTRKWVLSKMIPKKYGDTSKVQVDIDVKAVQLSPLEVSQAQEFAEYLAQKAIKDSQKALEEPKEVDNDSI